MLNRRTMFEVVAGVAGATLGARAGWAEPRPAPSGAQPELGSDPAPTTLPSGYRRPGNMNWTWGSEGILPTWAGGSGTKFDPRFIQWNSDKSATIRFDNVQGVWTAGEFQVQRPKRPVSERWGAVLSSSRPYAVCALFAYAKDGTEIDFEWRGDGVWQLNLHLFDPTGKRINPSPLPTAAVDIAKPHAYEFSMDAEACRWFIDGKEVARITPADMPGAVWNKDAKLELFVSIEHHGDWAKHTYTNLPATMTVHGILV
jgi:hypothetical protein